MHDDAIDAIANIYAPRVRRFRSISDVCNAYDDGMMKDENTDVLYIARDMNGRFNVRQCIALKNDRGRQVASYLQSHVMPYIDVHADLTGYYPISYHDTCPAAGVLTFNNRMSDRSVLLPDIYQMQGYAFAQDTRRDTLLWHEKESRMVFIGVSTGTLKTSANERIRACLWSLYHPKISLFRINTYCQIPDHKLASFLGHYKEALHHPSMHYWDQLKHRYVLSIDGNCAAWDRPAWVLSSKSLLLKMDSSFMCWYYHAMQANTHYAPVPSLLSLKNIHCYLENNPTLCQHMVSQANQFSNRYCLDRKAPTMYLKHLFEAGSHYN